MTVGAFCLVLHGHLPWVMHHGRWPHGEDWLYEAAAGTWLPLIEALDAAAAEGLHPGWTLGLTPILLEQLSSDRFKQGFVRWLAERAGRAATDAREFRAWGDDHLIGLAKRHEARFNALGDLFERLDRNIPGALSGREGVELLSSTATHAFLPLLLHDASVRAQLRAGLAASERHLGVLPSGIWLPECAYRPDGLWQPPDGHRPAWDRDGLGLLLGEEGVRTCFVDTHLVRGSRPVARLSGGSAEAVRGDLPPHEAWNSELEALRVAERGALTDLTVLARCPSVSEQVWSGKVGYPGDGAYQEFHKQHGMRGLRYWRVTGPHHDLGDKQPYDPEAAAAATYRHAQHFVQLIAERAAGHHAGTGRLATICAPFDAELFGHWWHEGPAFLLEVMRALHGRTDVVPMTVGARLAVAPADKAAALPAGTWGAGGDDRVWWSDELRFYWSLVWRGEDRFIDLWHRAPWSTDPAHRELLTEAGRQLLLLQASDWPFVISTRGAVDYGLRRIADHAARFDDLCNGVEDLLAGSEPDPVVQSTLARCRLVDPVFPELDLAWWG